MWRFRFNLILAIGPLEKHCLLGPYFCPSSQEAQPRYFRGTANNQGQKRGRLQYKNSKILSLPNILGHRPYFWYNQIFADIFSPFHFCAEKKMHFHGPQSTLHRNSRCHFEISFLLIFPLKFEIRLQCDEHYKIFKYFLRQKSSPHKRKDFSQVTQNVVCNKWSTFFGSLSQSFHINSFTRVS